MILQASNLSLIDGQESARLIGDVPSGAVSIEVDNISGFESSQFILIGEFGDSSAEIVQVAIGTSPASNTITLESTTRKDHYSDSKVTVVDYNQVQFFISSTANGPKVELVLKDVSCDRMETAYTDMNNISGFAFFRFFNSYTLDNSNYSSSISYSGTENNSVQKIVERACRDAGVVIGGDFSTEDMLLDDANDCQDSITDFDWKFELVRNDNSITAIRYENTYPLSELANKLKYPGISQGIKSVKFANKRLDLIDNDEMDNEYAKVVRTKTITEISPFSTSISLDNTSELPMSGTIYINGIKIPYTNNDKASKTLSGIDPSSITNTIAESSIVWYNINTGRPSKYTITIDNEIVFNVPVERDLHGNSITFEYLKELARFTDFVSTTEIPFPEIMSEFVKAKIEQRKRNFDNYDRFMGIFNSSLANKLEFYKLPIMDDSTYYKFTY